MKYYLDRRRISNQGFRCSRPSLCTMSKVNLSQFGCIRGNEFLGVCILEEIHIITPNIVTNSIFTCFIATCILLWQLAYHWLSAFLSIEEDFFPIEVLCLLFSVVQALFLMRILGIQ